MSEESTRSIVVPCLRCKGKGRYDPNPPNSSHVLSGECGLYGSRGCGIVNHDRVCDLCNGYGVLVATELKAVTKAEALRK